MNYHKYIIKENNIKLVNKEMQEIIPRDNIQLGT